MAKARKDLNQANPEFYLGRGPLSAPELQQPVPSPTKLVVSRLFPDPNVEIHVPETLKKKADSLILRKFSQDERCEFFENKDISDLFGVGTTFETELFHLEKGSFNDFDNSKLCISLDRVVKSKLKKYRLLVKNAEGKWRYLDSVILKDKQIQFDCGEFVSFIVVNQPKKQPVDLTPKGSVFKCNDDERIQASFAPGAVQEARKLTIEIMPAVKESSKESETSVLSPTLYVHQNQRGKFEKAVKVQLPVDGFQKPTDDMETVLLKWGKDEEEVQTLGNEIQVDGDLATFEVDSFSGISAVRWKKVKRTAYGLTIEAGLARKDLIHCRILTFFQRARTNFLKWECVEKSKIDDVVRSNNRSGLSEIPNSRSNDFFLYDGHMIRLKVGGCMEIDVELNVNKNPRYSSLIFLRVSDSNYQQLHLKRNMTISGDATVNLKYESDLKNRRRHEWTVRFFPDMLLGKTHPAPERRTSQTDKVANPKVEKALSVPGELDKFHPVNKRGSEGQISAAEPDDAFGLKEDELASDVTTIRASLPTSIKDASKDTSPFLSEKSLFALAAAIPVRDTLRLGVELGLNEEMLSQILENCQEGDKVFKILNYWVKNKPGDKRMKCQILVTAMKELGLEDFTLVVETACKENRRLCRADFASCCE